MTITRLVSCNAVFQEGPELGNVPPDGPVQPKSIQQNVLSKKSVENLEHLPLDSKNDETTVPWFCSFLV